MNEVRPLSKRFQCRIGAPDTRFENRPGGGVDIILDPGPTLAFVKVKDERYRVEVDGEPRPIRRVRRYFDQSEAGRTQMYDPELEEGEIVNLKIMMAGVKFNPTRELKKNGVELRSHNNWGHFRQCDFYRTTITLGSDGAVEVEEEIGEMDGSYY